MPARRLPFDPVLGAKIKKTLSSQKRPPKDRNEFAEWLWPGIPWDQTNRIAKAIRMTQDHADKLEGCVSYSPREGGYIWVDIHDNSRKSNYAQACVILGIIRIMLGAATMNETSAFLLRTWCGKSWQKPAVKRAGLAVADLLDYTAKATRSAAEDLRDAA